MEASAVRASRDARVLPALQSSVRLSRRRATRDLSRESAAAPRRSRIPNRRSRNSRSSSPRPDPNVRVSESSPTSRVTSVPRRATSDPTRRASSVRSPERNDAKRVLSLRRARKHRRDRKLRDTKRPRRVRKRPRHRRDRNLRHLVRKRRPRAPSRDSPTSRANARCPRDPDDRATTIDLQLDRDG